MRILLIICVLLFNEATAFAAPSNVPQTAKQLAETKQALAKRQAEEKKLAADMRKAEHALEAVQRDATMVARSVQSQEAALAAAETSLRSASRAREETLASLAKRRAAYKSTLLTMLRMKSMPPTVVFAPHEKREALRLQALALSELEAALRGKLAALKASQRSLEVAQVRAQKARDNLMQSQKQLRTQQEDMQRVLRARSDMYRTLSAQHGKAEQEARQLAASSKNLQDLMQKLQAQEAKIKQRAVAERSMQRAKGSLRAPAAGSVLHRYGEKKNENERYRGMVLATRAGATVVSPHDGQVAYSGAFREYGPMVLIRHAGGYMSLMAGLGSINVPVDARVRAGEPIGAMGRATKLYVELRERGKPIDPARWFAKLTR